MYLYHILIMILLTNLVFSKYSIDSTHALNFIVLFIIYFAVVLSASGTIYYLVDRRFLNIRKKHVG